MSPMILVVDDEAAICDGLAAYLEDEGMRVRTAHSGEEAVDYVASDQAVHVCIMDLRLPGMNGTEAILRIRRLAPRVRFIIHTGSAGDAVITELVRLGLQSTPVFKKPMADMTEIARTVRRLAQCG